MAKNNSSVTLGYDQIEHLLESEDFSRLNKSFAESYQTLELIFTDKSAGLKKQKDAQKAMKAYELTTDLLNYLLSVKKQLTQAGDAKKK